VAKKSREKSKPEDQDTDFNAPSFISRLFGPVKILIKLHLKVASNELKGDVKRFFSGIINLFIGLFSIIMCWILLNILAVSGLKYFFNELYSILIVAGANLLIALLMFVSAGSSFKKPFLKETTKIIKDTIDNLK
jgi:Putative Actinobacterial Holin-X, holin superfamily III